MIPNLEPIFQEYKTLARQADAVFSHVSANFPQQTKCAQGCGDCCHALFDLSLIEAMHINRAFHTAFCYGPKRSEILEKASHIDRSLTKMKREMFRAEKDGKPIDEIVATVGATRMRCPLLDDDDRCLLYEERPIICRLYGIPLEIGEKSHVCRHSGFMGGEKYPTARMAKIQNSLEQLSNRVADACGSRFELNQVYVPLSMALLTKYDEKYLGIGEPEE